MAELGRCDPSSGGTSPNAVDLEVEDVMSKQRRPSVVPHRLVISTPEKSHVANNNPKPNPPSATGILLPGLAHDGSRKSAFSPYKPTTVLTNLQRGNIETQTPCLRFEPSTHELAAQGELIIDDSTVDSSLNEADKDGLTPLMWAAYYGQLAMVNTLIARGVSVNSQTRRGETALHLASYNGHSDIVKVLLENNMDVDHHDEQGNTALMFAAYNNHSHCTQELLQHNADITKENAAGDTAYTLSISKGSRQVQSILERHLVHLLEPS